MRDIFFHIRLAERRDYATLEQIELSADGRFRAIPDLAHIAEGDPIPAAAYLRHFPRSEIWVAATREAPVGFARIRPCDDMLFLGQLSVADTAQGQGVGTALVEHVTALARGRGHRGVALFTFRDVPWNAPFYHKRGFRILERGEFGPDLSEIRNWPSERALDAISPRVAMGVFF